MEFTKEFAEENQLNEAQVTKLTEVTNATEAGIKKEYDGKAVTDAEGILNGVSTGIETLTGIKREQGEKYAEYLTKATDLHFTGTKATLERQKEELAEKLKTGGGSDALKAELETNKIALDAYKQKEAKFADWEENNYKEKYEQASTDLSKMNKRVAFSSVKPNFPDTVNPFEAKAKWEEAQTAIEAGYNITFDEASKTYYGVSKENEHISIKLSDLVAKNEELTALAKGRDQKGSGAGPKGVERIDGVPFDVPKEATTAEAHAAIRTYLAEKGINNMSNEYSKLFSELNLKIRNKK